MRCSATRLYCAEVFDYTACSSAAVFHSEEHEHRSARGEADFTRSGSNRCLSKNKLHVCSPVPLAVLHGAVEGAEWYLKLVLSSGETLKHITLNFRCR